MNDRPESAPIRRSDLPPIPPPESEIFTWFPHPDGGGDMVRGQRQRGVVVRRRVSYSDWEPVRPDRWAAEPPSDAPAAAPAGPAPATDRAALRERIADAVRDAACNGDCGKTEKECAKERIQPFVWHHGKLAVIEGTPEQIADAVLAVLPAPTDQTADRAAVLLEAADRFDRMGRTVLAASQIRDALRRLAGEAPPVKTVVADCNTGPGWYEVISPRATTCIVYVHEDGSLYLPEGEASLNPTEFAFAAARGNAHRLVRADDAQQDEVEEPDDTLHACPGRWGGPDCRCFDDEPAREAQQDPTQDGEAKLPPMDPANILGVDGAPAHCTGAEGFCAEHGFHRHAVARSGQPDTDEEA